MDYQESLDYLYGLQRFGIKLGLENIQALLDRLDHPERGYGVVHVAGTNGKGSVSATLATILQQAGYRVGLYTSPHLHSFTERIRIDGEAIEEREVARLTDLVRSRAVEVPATFFEFTTALALLHFRRRQVDFAILEAGMGGRLDATNAVTPRLSVITSICCDHSEHLGAELKAIAREKGGIIKEGVPVVIARQETEPLAALLEQARNRRAPVFLCGRDFSPTAESGGFGFLGMGIELTGLRPGLAGAHQHLNLALALAAAGELRRQGTAVSDTALRKGVEKVRWPGRLEWWAGREVLLDGAHNGGGAVALAAYLASLPETGIRWVVGIKGNRSLRDILDPVLPRVRELYCTTPPVEEAVAPALLVRRGEEAGIPAAAYETPTAALKAALHDRRENEIVLVAGSLFLVAAAREFLQSQETTCP